MAIRTLLIVENDVSLQKVLALTLRRYRINFDVVGTAENTLMMLESIESAPYRLSQHLPIMPTISIENPLPLARNDQNDIVPATIISLLTAIADRVTRSCYVDIDCPAQN